MSNQPFSFPPPPPPPPRRTVNTNLPQGNRKGRESHRGTRNRGLENRYGIERGSHKKDHSEAFSSPRRPLAAPAVPSFNASIEHLLSRPVPKTQPRNLLGLTPVRSDSEDCADEEAKLDADGLQFEYKGSVSTLRTPADVTAWIAERRQRYPTQAKRDAAKTEADAEQQKWEDEKRVKAEDREKREQQRKKEQVARLKENKQVARAEQERRVADEATLQAKLRTEKLRRKALKAQRELKAAEDALRANLPEDELLALVELATAKSADEINSISDSSELSDKTSSSGPDSDSAPEEMTSKKLKIDRVPPDRRKAVRKPCQSFMNTGRCRFGSDCKYSHIRMPTKLKVNATKRKGLWQVMVEKELEEEQKRAVEIIIRLGQSGKLEKVEE